MWITLPRIFFVTFLIIIEHNLVQCQSTNNETGIGRQEKVFSLFSIVSFKNIGCKSQSSATVGQSITRNGTCFTASECTSKGGTASGNCAAGFGVCCIFLVTSGAVNQNCTYIRNPGFPNAYTTGTQLIYTISKCSSDICFIRLDFEQFSIDPPKNEVLGGACATDAMKTVSSNGVPVPVICGINTGQHLYISLGDQPSDTATLTFSFVVTPEDTVVRTWEIKVTQIECSNLNRPPPGCQQYFTTPTGRITTFNFYADNPRQHLASQDISACIRRGAGYCCVNYKVCPNVDPDAFTIDSNVDGGGAIVDTFCTNDYVEIPASSGSCTNQGALNSKYCGTILNPIPTATFNAPVCSCSPPFRVHFHTDAMPDTPPAAGARGVCLDYNLVPCA